MIVALILLYVVYSADGKSSLRIIGGRDAKENEYVFVHRMELEIGKITSNNSETKENVHSCTCSALTPIWSLTASHCILGAKRTITRITTVNKTVKYVKQVVRHGSVSSKPGDMESFSDIIGTVMHPAYECGTINNLFSCRNDIGLLKTNPIRINNYLKLSSVDYKSLVGEEVVLLGYGVANLSLQDGLKGYTTLGLQKPLQVVNAMLVRCRQPLSHGFMKLLVYPSLCYARSCSEWYTVAHGDSGGPVIHDSGAVGVNTATGSYYNKDIRDRFPYAGISTPVSPFVEWITNQVQAE